MVGYMNNGLRWTSITVTELDGVKRMGSTYTQKDELNDKKEQKQKQKQKKQKQEQKQKKQEQKKSKQEEEE